jgi:beta-glucosidase
VDAGAATFMNSFNDINGIPATGSKYLQREILKGKWGFSGFVVSDWNSIGEMVNHGFAKDGKDAARAAMAGGNDMDMESNAYRHHLPQLIKENKVPLAQLNEAVRRVLKKKFEMELFDDPYRFSNPEREKAVLNNPEHRVFAREIAGKSIVLLKNSPRILPMSKNLKTIAFIGPQVKAVKDNHGFWSVTIPELDYTKFIVSQWDGVKNKLELAGSTTKLLYAKGADIEGENRDGFAEAIEIAKQADVVILSIGEHAEMSGEAKSRSNIHLPGVQEDLVKVIHATGKPMVVLINAGRPLVFNWTADNAPAILYTWWLGTEAGNAIADVLFGDVNPSAKLPITFPRSEGQIPIYYNHLSTGRPPKDEADTQYVSAYIDLKNSPQFSFGHGLSYADFTYADLKLSTKRARQNETIVVSLSVANTGKVFGEEIVQLYLRDKVASLVRPVMELKAFQKIRLDAGETKAVTFTIGREQLAFFNNQLRWRAEPGEFELMIGASSADVRLRTTFELID